MEKIAIITDSSSGIPYEAANKFGIYVLPIPVVIENNEYLDGITCKFKKLLQLFRDNDDLEIKTLPTPIQFLKEKIDELIEKGFNKILYIPVSSKISEAYHEAEEIKEKYNDVLYIIDNLTSGSLHKEFVLYAKYLVDEGKNINQIVEILNGKKNNFFGYIMTGTLNFLKNAGRMSKETEASFNDVPGFKYLISYTHGSMNSLGRARTVKKALQIIVDDLVKQNINRYNHKIIISHTADENKANLLKEMILEKIPNIDIVTEQMGIVLMCHIGPDSITVGCVNK